MKSRSTRTPPNRHRATARQDMSRTRSAGSATSSAPASNRSSSPAGRTTPTIDRHEVRARSVSEGRNHALAYAAGSDCCWTSLLADQLLEEFAQPSRGGAGLAGADGAAIDLHHGDDL